MSPTNWTSGAFNFIVLLWKVEEVKHYMIGLANMSKRGVIWKVNMAYDVLYEVRPNDAVYYYYIMS